MSERDLAHGLTGLDAKVLRVALDAMAHAFDGHHPLTPPEATEKLREAFYMGMCAAQEIDALRVRLAALKIEVYDLTHPERQPEAPARLSPDSLRILTDALRDLRARAPGTAPAWGSAVLCDIEAAVEDAVRVGGGEALQSGAAPVRSVGTRLVGYRAAALSAIAGTKIDDGGKTAERRTAEACERYAHAMLAAERPPEAAPAPLPGLSVDDRAVLRNAMIIAQENGGPIAWGDRFRGKVVAALAKVLGEDGASTVATCARCGVVPDASAGVVRAPPRPPGAGVVSAAETLNPVAARILAGLTPDPDAARPEREGEDTDEQILTALVLDAERLITTRAYHLRGERDLSPDARRRLMNAVAAQYGGR